MSIENDLYSLRDDFRDAIEKIGDLRRDLDSAVLAIGALRLDMQRAICAPVDDNHHNALACPYCNPERREFVK